MRHEQIKKQIQNMEEALQDKTNDYLISITKQIMLYSNNLITKEKLEENIKELFYSSFEETYDFVSSSLKKIYTKIKDFQVEDIFSLAYNEDGKTLDQRIEEYCKYASNLNGKEDKKDYLIRHFDDLLNNETKVIKNKIMKNKVGYLGQILVIENSGSDYDDICSQWVGEWAADEAVPLPPYHPSCQCFAYYEPIDDEEEVEDLEVENDENMD